MTNNVYIVNKGAHDYSAAKQYGDLVYLSNKPINRYATNNIYRIFIPILECSHQDDYILITSLNVMNVIACSIFVLMHGKLNLLIHRPKTNSYVDRKLDMSDILDQTITQAIEMEEE